MNNVPNLLLLAFTMPFIEIGIVILGVFAIKMHYRILNGPFQAPRLKTAAGPTTPTVCNPTSIEWRPFRIPRGSNA